jgi:hypothetical protein
MTSLIIMADARTGLPAAPSAAAVWAWAAGALTGALATALYFVWQERGRRAAEAAVAAVPARRMSLLSSASAESIDRLESQFHVSSSQLYSIMCVRDTPTPALWHVHLT